MSDSGLPTLDAWIARLKTLGGPTMPAAVARRAAPLVDRAVKATAAAGTTPDGQAWKPTKKGGRAMVNAAAHITTAPAGNFVIVQLTGPDVWHHIGAGRNPHRQVIPDSSEIPPAVAAALLEAARQTFREMTRA